MRNILIFILGFVHWNNFFSQSMTSKTHILDVERSISKLAIFELNHEVYNSINLKYSKNLDSIIKYTLNKQSDNNWIKIKNDAHSDVNYNSNDFSSTLIIIGKNINQFYLSFEGADKGLIEIEILEDANAKRETEQTALQSLENCSCSPPSYINRTDWGCPWGDESPNFIPIESKITHIVIHHQGGNAFPPYDATIRAIWNYHVNSNGWEDIGYHWLIDPDGIIYKGRAWIGENENVLGAHICGCNANKLGICLLGDFTNQGPTIEQYSSLVNFLAYKCCDSNIIPDIASPGTDRTSGNCQVESLYHLIGHRDGCPTNYTECPGTTFYSQFSQLINDVKNSYSNCILNTNLIEQKEDKIIIYPNPIQSEFTIKGSLNIRELEIYDLHGRKVEFEIMPDNDGQHLSLIAPRGTYIIKNKSGQHLISKLIKL